MRDLCLKRTPKDFDVITDATLKQVQLHSSMFSVNFLVLFAFFLSYCIWLICLHEGEKTISTLFNCWASFSNMPCSS